MIKDNEEKIVSLAVELLKNNKYKQKAYFDGKLTNNLSPGLSAMLVAASVSSAAVSGYYAGAYGHYSTRPLNMYERTEISALIFYAARTRNLREDLVKKELESFIGATIYEMTAREFSPAKSFLYDIIRPN